MTSSSANTPQPRNTAPSAASGGVGAVDSFDVPDRAACAWGALLVVAFIATFFEFFRYQFVQATTQVQDWGHTLLIPLIAGYFVYVQREKLAVKRFVPSWSAFTLLFLGLAIYSASAFGPQAIQHHNVRGVGVGCALLGCLLAVFGTASFRWLWFPWAYWYVFGQTISERVMSRVTERLQDWSAIGADILLNTLGIDTDRVGNVLTVHMSDGTTHPLNVAEACSGMRTLMAFLAIGVALAALGLPRWWQRVLLVVAGIPISLFVNVLRVASLGMLSMVDTNFSTGEFHSMVGLIWLVPAFLLFLGVMWVIRNMVDDGQAPPSPRSGVNP
ncbi:MAG: exosortase/archaeosortase family protein [Planctomycetota bacterium]